MKHSHQSTSSDGGVALRAIQKRRSPETISDRSIDSSSLSEPERSQYENITRISESDAVPNNHPNEMDAQDPEAPMMYQAAAVDEPARPLRWWDVSSLVINKMIGTGIFTAPPAVLILTGNKREALGLWITGFLYTLVSMTIYLEYARKLPHTGGELIYLDEAFPKPALLVYTVYAFLYILLNTSATSCMVFANQVYISATDDNNPDQRVLRLIAVVILTVVCLLHYFSARTGRDLNVVLATSKVVMLSVLFVAGAIKANKEHVYDFNQVNLNASTSSSSAAAGFLLILYSFQGWENATFVAGEIATYRTLSVGFVVAVFVVGILYIMVNVVFLTALPYTEGNFQYMAKFFGDTPKARQAWAVLTAISAAGTLVSVIYTTTRVKQAIGRSNMLFWSRLWRRNSLFNPATPEGGLILQWTMTVILISASSAIRNISEARSFPGLVYIYGQGLVGVFVGCGFVLLKQDVPLPTRGHGEDWTSPNEPKILQSLWSKVPLAAIFVMFNLAILIIPLIPPYQNADGSAREILGWYYIVIVSVIVLFAVAYYFAIHNSTWSILRLGGVQPKISTFTKHDMTYGNRREVRIITTESPNSFQNFVYWLFGGSDETRHPSLRFSKLFPKRRTSLE